MKRGLLLAVVVLMSAVLAFVISAWDPPRPRPDGWRAPWDSLPLEDESAWAPQRARRFLVQELFAGAVDELTECSQEYYREPESKTVQLELLIEVAADGARLAFVVPEPRGELAPGLMPCVVRALEKTKPVPTEFPAGTRWRLGLAFVLNPPAELKPAPWWQRFIPEAWRSGGGSAIHVG